MSKVLKCQYCGNEPCDLENHNPRYLRDLLIDAGILDESEEQWNKWLGSPIGDDAPGIFQDLGKMTPAEIHNMNHIALAIYVRVIM